jgi:hypothetical protein
MTNYSKPRILATLAATVAVKGADKASELQENIVGTPAAYEADE